MNYFLDCEFNGFGGELMSLALVREDGASLYLIYPLPLPLEPWVADNVAPILYDTPHDVDNVKVNSLAAGGRCIAEFLREDRRPHVVADWPDDIRYLCQTLITGPGTMVSIPHMTFEMARVDAYPTDLPGAVQHNAWWDAMALRHFLRRR